MAPIRRTKSALVSPAPPSIQKTRSLTRRLEATPYPGKTGRVRYLSRDRLSSRDDSRDDSSGDEAHGFNSPRLSACRRSPRINQSHLEDLASVTPPTSPGTVSDDEEEEEIVGHDARSRAKALLYNVSDELETEAVSKARSAFRALGAERDKDLRASNEVVKADYASRLATLTKETESKIGEKNRAFKEFVENTTKQERMKFLLEISEVTHCHLLDMHEDLFGAFAAR